MFTFFEYKSTATIFIMLHVPLPTHKHVSLYFGKYSPHKQDYDEHDKLLGNVSVKTPEGWKSETKALLQK
jgi:hypothetical protein